MALEPILATTTGYDTAIAEHDGMTEHVTISMGQHVTVVNDVVGNDIIVVAIAWYEC